MNDSSKKTIIAVDTDTLVVHTEATEFATVVIIVTAIILVIILLGNKLHTKRTVLNVRVSKLRAVNLKKIF